MRGLFAPFDRWRINALVEDYNRQSVIYEESLIGIEVYDGNGRLVDANGTCLKIFGVPDISSFKGFNLFENPNLPEEVKSRIRAGDTTRVEVGFDFNKVRERNLYPTSRQGLIVLDVLIRPLVSTRTHQPDGYHVQVLDITSLRQTECRLQRRLEIEQSITAVSTELCHLPANTRVEKGIPRALARIGAMTSADHCSLFVFSSDGATLSSLHEWTVSVEGCRMKRLRQLPLRKLPWLVENVRQHGCLHVPDVSHLPAEACRERRLLERAHTASLLAVPVMHEAAPLGWLGVDSIRTPRSWSEDDIHLLSMAGPFFAGALVHQRELDENTRLKAETSRLRERLDTARTKVLGGFIPICSECKSIRDEAGLWTPVETYVGQRSDARFSHSICPRCSRKLYGDIGATDQATCKRPC